MEVKLAQINNKGMYKDISISKATDDYAYHNENIRITQVDDNTLLSVTNEKGSSEVKLNMSSKTLVNNLLTFEGIHIPPTPIPQPGRPVVRKPNYANIIPQYKVASDLDITFNVTFGKQYGILCLNNDYENTYNIFRFTRRYNNVPFNNVAQTASSSRRVFACCSYFEEDMSLDDNDVFIINTLNQEGTLYEFYDRVSEEYANAHPELANTIYTISVGFGYPTIYLEKSITYSVPSKPFIYVYLGGGVRSANEFSNSFVQTTTDIVKRYTVIESLSNDIHIDMPFETNEEVRDYVSDGEIYSNIKAAVEYTVNSIYIDDYDDEFHYVTDPDAEEITIGVTQLTGKYIGHCIAGDYIILFTHSISDTDYIYRIDKNFNVVGLFYGDLDFDVSKPVEALYYYESEEVQKVYWVDGVNQPRVINIMKTNYVNELNTQFDFTPTLHEIPKVEITKNNDAIGNFHSGTIQYFITYYNKFFGESGIVWASSLYYISPEERAGAPDEFCSCSFNLDISDIDTTFEYIRIYSAKRQSIDGPVELNIVSDTKLSKRSKINITDIGSNQVSVDANMLLFLGGSNFVAGTITSKDNTLFLGNIELKEQSISKELKDYIKDNWIEDNDIKESKVITFEYKTIDDAEPIGFYPFKQQINKSSISFKTFKKGEIYRFGIQYQSKNGSWTSPIWIGDKICDLSPKNIPDEKKTYVATAVFNETEDSSYMELLEDKNYLSYRLLMAKTDISTRSVIAQGIVCPTIFNYKQRTEDKPYSISSYIMRPRGSNAEYKHLYPVGEIFGLKNSTLPIREYQDPNVEIGDNLTALYFTAKVSVSVNRSIFTISSEVYISAKYNNTTSDRILISHGRGIGQSVKEAYINFMDSMISSLGEYYTNYGRYTQTDTSFVSLSEIEEMNLGNEVSGWTHYGEAGFSGGHANSYIKEDYELDKEQVYNQDLYDKFFRIVHDEDGDVSPFDEDTEKLLDNEFYVDESIVTLNSPEIMSNYNLLNQAGLNFRVVGIAPITSNNADFSIHFKPETIKLNYSGINLPVPEIYYKKNISSETQSLLNDYLYNGIYYTNDTTQGGRDDYKIYLWHHVGSVIGRDSADDTIDVIESKTISNKRFSIGTEYFDSSMDIPISSSDVFNDDNIGVRKLKLYDGTCNYYGNYEYTMIPNESGSDIIRKYQDIGKTYQTTSPVHIAYNSLPHVVLPLFKDDVTHQSYLLPRLTSDDDTQYDYLDYTFKDNETKYIDSMLDEDCKQCIGIVKLDYQGDSIINHLDSFISQYYPNGLPTGSDLYVMESFNSYGVDYPKIAGVYLIEQNYSVTEKHDFDNDIFVILNKGGYRHLPILNKDNTTHVKYRVNSKSRELTNLNISLTKYIRNTIDYSTSYPYLFIGEIYKDIPYDTLYGGYDENAIENINWIPISECTALDSGISLTEGDTFYQRWDCVKTIPRGGDKSNNVIDITSVLLESHYCLDGRWDRNRINSDLLNISVDNYNLFNDAYTQSNNIFSYNILDDKYDLDNFTNQILWSKQKSPAEDIDTWTNISQLSSIYLDGEYGPINKLINFNDNIVAFQDKAIASIMFNNQIQVSTEQGLPIEVVNSGKVTGYNYITKINGCHNKWSICESNSGLFFIDDYNKAIFRFNKDGLTNLSLSLGFARWSDLNISTNIWNIDSNAFRVSSDKIKHDVYFIKNDSCLCYNEDTQTFTSFYTEYIDSISMFNLNGKAYYIGKDLKIHEMFAGDYLRNFSVEYNINPEPLVDKIFTNIEYISDTISDNELNHSNPFKTLVIGTEYQHGETNLLNNNYPNSAVKFRIWRADIPRDSVNKFDRIRNPWAKIKLIGNNLIDGLTTLHSLIVKYFK